MSRAADPGMYILQYGTQCHAAGSCSTAGALSSGSTELTTSSMTAALAFAGRTRQQTGQYDDVV
jgi:hypothetical protein